MNKKLLGLMILSAGVLTLTGCGNNATEEVTEETTMEAEVVAPAMEVEATEVEATEESAAGTMEANSPEALEVTAETAVEAAAQ